MNEIEKYLNERQIELEKDYAFEIQRFKMQNKKSKSIIEIETLIEDVYCSYFPTIDNINIRLNEIIRLKEYLNKVNGKVNEK